MGLIRRLLIWLAAICMVWVITVYLRIGKEAGGDPLEHSDAIVVFGAAEYAGKPSPIFRSRLDHAFELWQAHWAPVIITTGGRASDPSFSEGGVGGRYLQGRGIPESAIIAETQAADTSESARRVSKIMHVNGMSTCIAVSDGYHLFRIKRMMRREGVTAHGAPRRELHAFPQGHRLYTKIREAVSYSAWLLHIS
ncbi:MAG: hypothetical protein NVS9B15_06680 [Acidobacteriaceae bacterium]